MKSIKTEIETKKTKISFLENGIVRVLVKPNVTLEEADLDEYYEIYQGFLNNEKAPFLISFGAYSSASQDAREKFGNKKRANLKSAEALVLTSLPHRLMATFHIKIFKPKHPTKIFSSEEEALKWLQNM